MSKKRLLGLSSLFISIGILLFLGEVGVRLFVKNGDITPGVLKANSVQYEPAVFARHVFKQEARTVKRLFGRKKGMVWEMNEKGYRGEAFDVPKPKGTTRIIIYGGSAVFDIENTRGQDWPHRVQEKLRKIGWPSVEVINAGIMGHTALESVGKLLAEGHRFEPDYVLIYNAWNDIKYFDSPKPLLRTLRPAVQGFDPRIQYMNVLDGWLCEGSQLYTVLRRIYFKRKWTFGREGMRKPEASQNSIEMLHPHQFRQYQLALETFVDVARNIGAKPILVTQARLPHESNDLDPQHQKRIDYHHVGLTHAALLETFNRQDEIVRKVAEERHAVLIDASAHLSGKPEVFFDHVHVTNQGSEALAQFIADRLNVILLKG